MEYGQSLDNDTQIVDIILYYLASEYALHLIYQPYQSLLFKLENGKAEQIDIEFVPATPVVKERPEGYKAPWLVF